MLFKRLTNVLASHSLCCGDVWCWSKAFLHETRPPKLFRLITFTLSFLFFFQLNLTQNPMSDRSKINKNSSCRSGAALAPLPHRMKTVGSLFDRVFHRQAGASLGLFQLPSMSWHAACQANCHPRLKFHHFQTAVDSSGRHLGNSEKRKRKERTPYWFLAENGIINKERWQGSKVLCINLFRTMSSRDDNTTHLATLNSSIRAYIWFLCF